MKAGRGLSVEIESIVISMTEFHIACPCASQIQSAMIQFLWLVRDGEDMFAAHSRTSAEYKEMTGFRQECHEEEVAKIVKVRGLIENFPDGPLLQYRRSLKRSTSSLLLDLDMYDIATREGNKKRVAHMARSSPWFKKNFGPLANISKNPSAPGFLTFNREDAPAPGSQRVFHRNSIYVREPSTYRNPALTKTNYALVIPLDQD
ncbi:unnamed protein product [Amoebophrya sp. A120]|nr:unnamed protein product [Amoebophrya sp. A120]|eukprot:GSA120T00020696001.1